MKIFSSLFGMGWIIVLFSILSLIIWIHYVPASSQPNNIRRSSLKLPSNPAQSIRRPITSLSILLQLSQVDQRNQLLRLDSIDQSWARWSNVPNVHIFASTPLDDNSTKHIDSIKFIRLDPVQKPNVAYRNMLEALFKVLVETSDNWIFMGNDHTFVVTSNLVDFLFKINPEYAMYGGNRLQRGLYKEFPLYFASGGAGAIFSRPSLVFYFLALAALEDKLLVDNLNSARHFLSKNQRNSNCSNTFDHLSENFETDCVSLSGWHLVCLLQGILHWKMEKNLGELTIEVSPKHKVTLHRVTAKSIKISVKTRIQMSADSTSLWSDSIFKSNTTDIRGCQASSEWDRMNPGLVVAYCLQAVFGVKFIESTDVHDTEPLNVYGAVRTLFGPADKWYTDARIPFAANIHNGLIVRHNDTSYSFPVTPSIETKRILEFRDSFVQFNPKALVSAKSVVQSVSRFPISFHYVSQVEATLLFQMLTCRDFVNISFDEFRKRWPHNDKDAGHYSRWRISEDEAQVLYWYATSYATVLQGMNCPLSREVSIDYHEGVQ